MINSMKRRALSILSLAAILCDIGKSQSTGGFTQPYFQAQPWSNEPMPQYLGSLAGFRITTFSSVRITGLPLNDNAASAQGVFLPLDRDGDGADHS